MSRPTGLCILLCLGAAPAAAEMSNWGYTTFGTPGLIDMPSAVSDPDGELAFTTSYFASQTRHTLTFQIAPRLSGSFTYALLYGISPGESGDISDLFDRSFSLRYVLATETDRLPAIAIGLNDFLGTGVYSGEYLVATKSLGDRFRVTGGLGWGRLAGVGGFDNPLGDRWNTRPGRPEDDLGGTVQSGQWFRGPAALFGGVEWKPDDNWTFVAEYSSDAYGKESPSAFDRESQVNLGLRYKIDDRWTFGAQYLYGSELGAQFTYAINPAEPRFPSGLDTAPPLVRAADAAAARSWGPAGPTLDQMQVQSAGALSSYGITLLGLAVNGATARAEIGNDTYQAAAQAVGRTARVLTSTLPPAVTRFDIVLVERGLPVVTSAIRRADLQELEFALDGAWDMQSRTVISDPGPGTSPMPGVYPRFDWDIDPYLQPALFDPDAPFRADIGLDFGASYEFAPGLFLSGVIRQPLAGNLDQSTRASDSVLPRVRSDAWLYDKADTRLHNLTAAWFFRPGENLFGRVTAGYLETMFGGVSGEVLWYPQDSRLALGAEINYAVQRDFDQLLGFQDYDVATGHLSGYLDIGKGYRAQLDVGRYLAGDYGATVTLNRVFENGWSVGAYATLTDVPFEDFGEGSFDKGIRVTIPVGWITGRPSRDRSNFLIQPILRDGGARLSVQGRLYETLRDSNGAELADGWGRFWR